MNFVDGWGIAESALIALVGVLKFMWNHFSAENKKLNEKVVHNEALLFEKAAETKADISYMKGLEEGKRLASKAS